MCVMYVVCRKRCVKCNWVLVLVRMSYLLAAACQDVPSFVRWPIMCVTVWFVCDLGPCASQDAPSFSSSLSRCPIFCQVAHRVCDVCLVCNWVLVLVRMSHPLAAACQDVPSFVKWPIVCVTVHLVFKLKCANQDLPLLSNKLSIFHQPTHCHIGVSYINLLFTDSVHVTYAMVYFIL